MKSTHLFYRNETVKVINTCVVSDIWKFNENPLKGFSITLLTNTDLGKNKQVGCQYKGFWKSFVNKTCNSLRPCLTLQWRHNGHDSVSNNQPHACLLNRLFRRRSKKTSKLRVTGLCEGNSPGTGEFPAQMASNAENVSIWWRHHGQTKTKPETMRLTHRMFNPNPVWWKQMQNLDVVFIQMSEFINVILTNFIKMSLFCCPACRTYEIATRFWVVVICPIIKCLTVLEFSFILFDLCFFITIFNFILNYVLFVTFWIFTYHKIWILLLIYCFIWNFWIIYFLTCLEVFWGVVG